MEGGDALLPFVSQYHNSPSNICGRTTKGWCMRSHRAKEGTCQHCFHLDNSRRPDERLMAFLDDFCAKSNPNRSVTVFTAVQEEFQRVAFKCMMEQISSGPNRNRSSDEAARISDPDAIVRRGDVSLLPQKVLGIPMGSPEFVRSTLAAVSAKHDSLISQIVGMSDLQCAWILLLYCAAARRNCMLEVVHPTLSAGFVRHHDASLRQALSQLVAAPPCNMHWDVHGEVWGFAVGHVRPQFATDAVHAHFVETQIRPRLSGMEQAMLRS